MKIFLSGLLIVAACATEPAPDPAALDPDESRSDARIEGIWQRDDGTTLYLNDDGSLRIDGQGVLQGERWDAFGDSLALYVQPGGDGIVARRGFGVDTLDATRLVLAPCLLEIADPEEAVIHDDTPSYTGLGCTYSRQIVL